MTQKKIVKQSDKLSKDDLDPSKDEFVVRSISFLDWVVERRRQIGVLLAVVLLLAVGAIVYADYQESKAAELSSAVSGGLDAATAPILLSDGAGDIPAEVDDDVLTFESEAARATQTIKLLDEALSTTQGHSVEKAVSMVRANALFELGKVDEAIKEYNAFLAGSAGQLDWLRPNALQGLAVALEAKNDIDGAMDAYRQLSEVGKGRISLWARYNEARLSGIKGDDKAGIVAALTDIVKEIADAGDVSELDYLFVEARARLLQLDPDADVPDVPGGLGGFSPELLQQLIQARQQTAGGGL